MTNQDEAPAGAIWVCAACGKTAQNRAGTEGLWDESCFLKAVLCDKSSLVFGADGRVTDVFDRITELTAAAKASSPEAIRGALRERVVPWVLMPYTGS